MTSRGIRNNNPGNIDYNPATKWQGLDTPPIEPKPENGRARFARFKTPAFGIRAIARVLIRYQDEHHLDTVSGIIHRWAPSIENPTDAYVRAVSTKLGVAPVDPINVHEYRVMRALVEAIIRHENGSQPYSAAEIDRGLALAGVVPPAAKSIMRKVDVAAQAGGPTGLAAAGAADKVQDALQGATDSVGTLAYTLEIAQYVFLSLSLGLFAFSMYRLIAKLKATKGE